MFRSEHFGTIRREFDILTNSQFEPLIGKELSGNDSSLPSSIRAIKPICVVFSRHEVQIIHGGGHHHFWMHFRSGITNPAQFDLVFQDESEVEGKDNDPEVLLYSLRTR